jgi:GDP-L-fucose synthase
MKKKLLILGSSGMLGSSVFRLAKDYFKVLSPNRKDLDLFDKKKVDNFFKKEEPHYVVNCAAKVGGIYANTKYPADFIYENLLIQNNVIFACHKYRTKKLVFLGSACIYPRDCKQPIKENYLLTGLLEKTNEYYAVAKIAGLKMIEAFNNQYNHNFISIMPSNIYGINDNFHTKNSHVISALIDKIYKAFKKNKKNIKLWGSGKALRDFLYVDDAARAILFLLKHYNKSEPINVGSGKEISIKSLSQIISKIIGYKGDIMFDYLSPDGTPRKILDISKIKKMGWEPMFDLKTGLEKTIKWYIHNDRMLRKK